MLRKNYLDLCKSLANTIIKEVSPKKGLISQSSCGWFLQTREYKPYSKIPAKFRKKNSRDIDQGNDCYFLTDQIPAKHTVNDAIDMLKAYDLFGPEPIDLLLQVSMADGKGKIQPFKGLISFPTSIKPAQTVLVFAEGELAEQARKAGADIVGGVELIEQVENGELEFDHCLSSLDFLPNIKHLPRILKNKMPNTRRETATNDLPEAVKKYRGGELYISDAEGNLRQTLALTSFGRNEICSNVKEFLSAVQSHKPKDSKGAYFLKASLIIPPGPKVDLIVSNLTEID